MKDHRVNQFKKQIRETLKCDWMRFYWSKDKSHFYIRKNDFYEESFNKFAPRLEKSGVQFSFDRWGKWFDNSVRGIKIPIDQEAFPQPKIKQGGQSHD